MAGMLTSGWLREQREMDLVLTVFSFAQRMVSVVFPSRLNRSERASTGQAGSVSPR